MSTALRVYLLRPELASLPAYATKGAAGLDLRAAIPEPLLIAAGETLKVPTGMAVALPPGHEGQVRPRSGLAFRHAITVLNSPGTIDEDYRGEIAVLLVNHGRVDHEIQPGDRIAQLVVAPVTRVGVQPVSSLEALGETRRGQGGFGSTGR
jgi:dUTP pyrophosphatase